MIVLIPWDEFTKEKVMEKVKGGDTCVIIKDGKQVVEINAPKENKQGWKRKIDKIVLPEGLSISKIIDEERESAKW